MKVKGAAVKSIYDYIKNKQPQRYQEWLMTLPERSKLIMSSQIISSEWYDLHFGVILPTQSAGKLFFDSEIDAAWQLGRYSSDLALKGLFKIIVKMASPGFIISRASQILTSYYDQGKVTIDERNSNHVKLIFSNFGQGMQILYNRIGGWLENTFEVIKLKNVRMELHVETQNGEEVAIMIIDWE